jgi:hypothetical protein
MTNMQTWATPEWRAGMDGWIEQRLAERGIRVTGAIEQPHLYPWSTVLRVPTSEGLVYAKATMAGFDHEPRLTAALAGWRPDLMPDVLAIDDARGWMLTRDAGPMLRTITRTDPPNLAPWLEILPRYAELQIDMIPRRDELLALGAIDHRLATLPDQLALMLADDESLRIGPPDGLTDEEIEQLLARTPRFAEMCDELAGYGIPETLQHDDFHDGNIFIGGGRVIFADWAECCVAHPFITLRVTLRASAHFAGMPEDAPPIVAMRDAYLEPWTQFVPQPDLLRSFTLSQQIANVARTRTWHRVINLLTGDERRREADTVPYNLRQFLATMGT